MRRQEVVDIMEGNGATELFPVFGPDGGVLLWFPVNENEISMELTPEQAELVG